MAKFKAKLKTKTSEAKLQELAEQFTHTMATEGISRDDALLVVLNMLRYHSGLCFDKDMHEAFMEDFTMLLRRYAE
jgi:hypothetical protein